MDDDREALAELIRTERARRHLTQEEVATQSGLSKAYISHLETGRRAPSERALRMIAETLGLPVPKLMLAASMRAGRGPDETPREGHAAAEQEPGSARESLRDRIREFGDRVDDWSRTTLPSWVRSRPGTMRYGDVEVLLSNRGAATELLDAASDRFDQLEAQFGDDIGDLARTLHALVDAFIDGAYRGCRRETAVMAAAALSYIAEPHDGLSDETDTGLADDLGVIVLIGELFGDDFEDFEAWAKIPD